MKKNVKNVFYIYGKIHSSSLALKSNVMGGFFPVRCYASAVPAMVLCLCLSVCHKSVWYRNGWTDWAGFWTNALFHLPYTASHEEIVGPRKPCDRMDVYIGATWQIQLIDFFRDGYAAFGRITLIICYILGCIARTKSKYAANVLSMLRGLCVCVCWLLSWAVQKRPNRSRCGLGCGLRWTKETML